MEGISFLIILCIKILCSHRILDISERREIPLLLVSFFVLIRLNILRMRAGTGHVNHTSINNLLELFSALRDAVENGASWSL